MARVASKPDISAQFRTRGYIINEDNDFALGEIATAMIAMGSICEAAGHTMPELNGFDYAAIFRSFGRQIQHIHDAAPFTGEAMARKRDD